MALMDLRFEEAGHKYWHEGHLIPSVTQVIDAVYPPNHHYTESSRQRGRAVHRGVELFEKGILDWSSVHESILGYMEAYKKAKKQMSIKPNPDELERIVYHPNYRFAGRIDVIDRPNARIIDIKSGAHVPEVVLQQAGYKLALEDDEITDRLVLYLQADGNYKITVCRNPEDIRAFINVLGCYNWGKVNGKF